MDGSKKRRDRNNKKWSTKKKVLIATITVFLLIISAIVYGYSYVKSRIYTAESTPSKVVENPYEEVEGITNVLLIGSDARDLDENSRSDSMIIATLDNNNDNIKLTSLFRDTLVDIPGYGERKLNEAFALGGAELLMDTISDTYEIYLEDYVIINFWGFETVIDYIGGVEVEVKDYQIEELNKYIGESTGGNDCPVTETGVQVLNGKQALSYARIRYNTGDEYERTERQQEVIFKVAEKLQDIKPTEYLGIINALLDTVKTNIDPLEAVNMAYTIYKFETLETKQLQIPIPELTEGRLYKDKGWVFLMDREQNTEFLHDFIFNNIDPDSEKFDYTRLYQVLQQYSLEESGYNSQNDINPEDYAEPDKYEPSNGSGNYEDNNTSNDNHLEEEENIDPDDNGENENTDEDEEENTGEDESTEGNGNTGENENSGENGTDEDNLEDDENLDNEEAPEEGQNNNVQTEDENIDDENLNNEEEKELEEEKESEVENDNNFIDNAMDSESEEINFDEELNRYNFNINY